MSERLVFVVRSVAHFVLKAKVEYAAHSFRVRDYSTFLYGNKSHSDRVTVTRGSGACRFLEKYPRYQGRPFWITGESYAGHYIPLLAQSIVHGNRRGVEPTVNLKVGACAELATF
jgi:hypothetical protein